ncbi:MAG: glycohydrolase toxin TNT-related protein [Marinoscillum sp.]|uniref:glycohydrolase toxin TNT-related protein n=1 Tax=Marinoscillum sp. TaxID=2024838 RepID=UPI0032F5DA74
MFKNLFKKKNSGSSIDELTEAVNGATLRMLNHQLFMHYFDENTSPEPENPAWQNQGIFFWSANEPFEKKSLPPEFQHLEERYFIVNEIPSKYSVSKGDVMPWFGMPGGGEKYFILSGQSQIPINELISSGSLSYLELVSLTKDNMAMLHDREHYYLLLDSETVRYEPNSDKFFFKNNECSLGEVYKQGGIRIVRMK